MKKHLMAYLSLFILFVLIMPSANAKELETEKVICTYEYQGISLTYKVYSDKVELPFEDGKNNWYHGAEFKDNYLLSSKQNSINYICPTITIEETSSFTTVFNNSVKEDECNGTCTTLIASKVASQENITVKKAVETTAISSVGHYKETSYFIPYFRLLEDGTKEWSINGKQYFDVSEKILLTDKNTTIKLNKSLINEIFKNNTLSSDVTIYRNVKKEKSSYEYLLSTKKEKGYNLTDGQETSSSSYNGALGAKAKKQDPTESDITCAGLLGDPNDPKEESVAWLIQKVLDYLRIIAPFIVVIMSGIDFGKVVITSDDESMKKAQSKLITRLLLAGSLFFLVEIVRALLALFGLTANPLCGIK